MALFSTRAELQQIEFDVTVFKGDDENPPITIRMRAIPERKYEQLAADWLDRDRKDFMRISFNGKKIGEHYVDHIVMTDNGLIVMSGLTIGNQARLTPQQPVDETDRQRFYQAGPEGVRLNRQEFIGLCEWCPASFAVPMTNAYKEELDKFGKERGVREEAQRKNSLNGRADLLESAA